MNTQDVDPADLQASAPGVSRLEGTAAKLQKSFAMGVMIIPLLGTFEAGRLLWQLQIPAWAWWLFGVMYFVHMFGVTAGLHRLAAHTGFKTSDTMKIILTVMGSMAAQGPLYYWVSQHRRHHSYSDKEGDPHTPNLHKNKWVGLWYSHMPWMLSRHVSAWNHYAKDTLRDPAYFFVHRYYLFWVVLGFAIPAIIGGLITGDFLGAWIGFIFGGLARMFCANQSAWMVGSISHRYGSRQFDTDDQSKNNWIVAILAFGEGLQNNHHAFPVNYRHSIYWYEPDLTGWILAIMSKFGLVWDLRFPNEASIKKLSTK